MDKVISYTSKILEIIVVALLAAMAVMVFTNVVLRYATHISITTAEELSRYFFVWVTFLGAVLAIHRWRNAVLLLPYFSW